MALAPVASTPAHSDPIFRAVGLRRRYDGRMWSLDMAEYEYYDDTGQTERHSTSVSE
jgi:hypothetical protein